MLTFSHEANRLHWSPQLPKLSRTQALRKLLALRARLKQVAVFDTLRTAFTIGVWLVVASLPLAVVSVEIVKSVGAAEIVQALGG